MGYVIVLFVLNFIKITFFIFGLIGCSSFQKNGVYSNQKFEPKEVFLWPGSPPDPIPIGSPENEMELSSNLVAGKPWKALTNISNPSYTVYPAKTKNTGAAVVVFPGGGYQVLAIDLEGTEICDWLTSSGITCVLLKYRVPNSGCHWEKGKGKVTPKSFTAVQDAKRAIRLVRSDAKALKINPFKIGVIGFSAGGNLVAMISSHFSKRLYPSVDEADKVSARPDFAIALYPGHMTMKHKNNFKIGDTKLNSDLNFAKDSPPTFLLHARDDKVNPYIYSTLYRDKLKELGVSVEIHLFEKGGHAFGLRPTSLPVTKWPSLVEDWLVKINIL